MIFMNSYLLIRRKLDACWKKFDVPIVGNNFARCAASIADLLIQQEKQRFYLVGLSALQVLFFARIILEVEQIFRPRLRTQRGTQIDKPLIN